MFIPTIDLKSIKAAIKNTEKTCGAGSDNNRQIEKASAVQLETENIKVLSKSTENTSTATNNIEIGKNVEQPCLVSNVRRTEIPKSWPKYSTVPAILETARSNGLNVFCISETPGDGNCFYWAIIEQLRDRTDLGDVSALNTAIFNRIQSDSTFF